MNSDFLLAVHALVFLNHKRETVNSEALAENICTNPARVRRVMTQLGRAGLVETRRGRTDGGYYFSLRPETVTLGQVAKALDVLFAATEWRSGDPHMACRIASGISDVMDGVYSEMNQACMERLEHTTIQDIDWKLFGERLS